METLIINHLAEILIALIAPFVIQLGRSYLKELKARNVFESSRYGDELERRSMKDAIAYSEEQDRKAKKEGKEGLSMEEKLRLALGYYIEDMTRRPTLTPPPASDSVKKVLESILNQTRV